jgi:hypothetical protein
MLNHSQNLINLRTKCPFFLFKEFSSHLPTFDYLLFESIPLTLLSLLPISELIKFIERDQSPSAHIFHLLKYAKRQNETYQSEAKKSILLDESAEAQPFFTKFIEDYASLSRELQDTIDSRMEKTGNQKLAQLMYMFTFEGRQHFREENPHFIISEDPKDYMKNLTSIPLYHSSIELFQKILTYIKSLPLLISPVQSVDYREFRERLRLSVESDVEMPDSEEGDFEEEEELLSTPLLTEESEFREEESSFEDDELPPIDILGDHENDPPVTSADPNTEDPAPIPVESIVPTSVPRGTPFNSAPNYDDLSEEQQRMLQIVPELPKNISEEKHEFFQYIKQLEIFARNLGYSTDEIKATKRCFFNWVAYSLQDLAFDPMESASAHQIWRIHSQYIIWGPLAKIASRLLSIVAHEAAVEREFSKIRFHIGDLRTNTSSQLRDARLAFV